MGKVAYPIKKDVNHPDAFHMAGSILGQFIFCEFTEIRRLLIIGLAPHNKACATILKARATDLFAMMSCFYCSRRVIDDSVNKTEEFGLTRNGKYICARCARAFQFSLGS